MVGVGQGNVHHHRALAAVAFATTAEEHMQMAMGHARHGGEGLFITIGGMGIINQHAGSTRQSHRLHAPRHRLQAAHAFPQRVQGNALMQGHPPGRRRVGDIVGAGKGNPQFLVHLRPRDAEGLAFAHIALVLDAPGGLRTMTQRLHRQRIQFAGQSGTPGAIHIHQTQLQLGTMKEGGLHAEVILHVLVVIQMLGAQVQKDRAAEAEHRFAALGDGVAGDFHHHMAATLLQKPGGESGQPGSVRRGESRGCGLALTDATADGAHQTCLGIHRRQQLLQHPGGAGLPVGARDAMNHQIRLFQSGDAGGGPGQPIPRVLHHQLAGQAAQRFRLGQMPRAFHNAHHALLQQVGNMVVAVRGIAAQRHEEIAGLAVAGIRAQAGAVLIHTLQGPGTSCLQLGAAQTRQGAKPTKGGVKRHDSSRMIRCACRPVGDGPNC